MSDEQLRTLMDRMDLSVKDVAQICMVSKWAVYRWVDGTRNMPPLAAKALIDWSNNNG